MEKGGFARERDCDLIGEFEKGRNVLNSIFFLGVCANLGSFFKTVTLRRGERWVSRV